MAEMLLKMLVGAVMGLCYVLAPILAFFGFGMSYQKHDGTLFFGTLAVCALMGVVGFGASKLLSWWERPKVR